LLALSESKTGRRQRAEQKKAQPQAARR
jgi:hypothetical protein